MGCNCLDALLSESLSSWRAWIEIRLVRPLPQAARRRSPHGERGLKFALNIALAKAFESLSSWRAWIEIVTVTVSDGVRRSLSSWRAWIEISTIWFLTATSRSLSSWRAWIEMPTETLRCLASSRSPHGERGLKFRLIQQEPQPARRSLSSWRAWIEICRYGALMIQFFVALLMESVD